MCLNQKWLYKTGKYKTTNYRGLEGQPYELGTLTKCGCCSQCLAEKANSWVVRNYFEEKRHQKKCFITLTYRDNPIILVKKDLQNFIKRLRARLKYIGFNEKIRYFAAGEYGDLRGRCHFHVIIYGWEDENIEYLGLNKKGNLIYKSKLIEEVWGLGRTSYQKFGSHEAPYVALYNTAKETFKKAYKFDMKKLKMLKDYANDWTVRFDKHQRKNLHDQIIEMQKQLEKSKKQYLAVKEFNTWSLALGWKEWEKEYDNAKNYVFECYIEDKTFVIPSPWIKKMANMGDIRAAEEMFRRERDAEKMTNAEQANAKAQKIALERKKEEILEYQDRKNKFEL